MDQKKTISKNPTECAVVSRRKEQLIVEAHLSKWDEEAEYQTPLMLYHNKFAFFKFIVINNGKAGTANVHTRDIPGIVTKYHWAYQQHMEYEMPESDSATSAAYTERFQMGTLKGKTPADVLNADGKRGRDTLREQYKFLRDNAEKYPANKKLMAAIVEAVKLHDAGELQATQGQTQSNEIVLFDAPMRGNVHKKREDGKSPISDFRVAMELGKDSPIVITLVNYWANIRVKEDGTLRVDAQNKVDISRYSIRMTLGEWDHIMYMMETEMRIFENTYGLEFPQKKMLRVNSSQRWSLDTPFAMLT